MKSANIFDPTQLDIKGIIMSAIFQHYGWEMNRGGKWEKGQFGRDIPANTDKLTIKRHDFFIRKHLGTEKSIKFFEEAQNASAPFISNFHDASMPAKKFYVMSGLQMETAVGVVGASVDQLNFGKMAETELETGLFSLDVNQKPVLKKQPIISLFENDDVKPNFLRLPSLVVWEPNEKMEAEIRVNAAVNDFWADLRVIGWIIE